MGGRRLTTPMRRRHLWLTAMACLLFTGAVAADCRLPRLPCEGEEVCASNGKCVTITTQKCTSATAPCDGVKNPCGLTDGGVTEDCKYCCPCPKKAVRDRNTQCRCPPGSMAVFATSLPSAEGTKVLISCLQCNIGKYNPDTGSTAMPASCIKCPSGTYTPDRGARACLPCPAGSTSLEKSTALTDCLANKGFTGSGETVAVCTAGKYKATAASPLACTDCDAGKFKASTEQTSDTCILCPAHTGVEVSGSDAESDCLASKGYSGSGPSLAPCASGTYKAKAASSDACTNCPNNTGISSPGSDAQSNCVADAGYTGDGTNVAACELGKYKNAAESSEPCLLCKRGEYNPNSGSTVCLVCPPDTYNPTVGERNVAGCRPCPPGSSSGKNSTALIDCLGKKGFTGRGDAVAACASGTYKGTPDSAEGCELCSKGTHSSEDHTQCPPCAAGKFTDKPGQGLCETCLDGEFQSETNETACDSCPPSHFLPDNRTACYTVPGYVGTPIVLIHPNHGISQILKAGLSPLVVTSTDTDTERFGTSEFFKASNVTITMNTIDGANTAVTCQPRPILLSKVSVLCLIDASALAIQASDQGETQLKMTITREGTLSTAALIDVERACKVGEYGEAGKECLRCPLGQFQDVPGQSKCKNCLEGRTTLNPGTVNNTFCTCEPGKEPSGDICLCPAGTEPVSNSNSCSNCTQDHFSVKLGTACAACPERSEAAVGSSACKCKITMERNQYRGCVCPIGWGQAALTSTLCEKCASDFYSDEQGFPKACKPCPAAATTLQTLGSTAKANCTCPSPSIQNSDDMSCACPPGYKMDSLACTLCERGKYQDETHPLAGAEIDCKACGIGMTTSEVGTNGTSGCICEVGKQLAADSESCVCPAGTRTDCDCLAAGTCPAGCSPGSEIQCVACDAGTFNSEQGASACANCEAGQHSPEGGATTCTACSAGHHSPQVGESACTPCVAGQHSSEGGATTCLACSAGQHSSNDGASTCAACSAGHHNLNAGATVCMNCEAGQHSSDDGATTCSACSAGHHSPQVGATTCSACNAGQYSSKEGATACANCKAGQHSSENASTTCTACSAGQHSSDDGAATCDKCSPGHHNLNAGAATCTLCVPGKHNAKKGALLCIDCGVGMRTLASGSVSKDSCVCEVAAGWPNKRMTRNREKCVCPAGTKKVVESGDQGASRCENCDFGKYSDNDDQQVCQPCPPGKTTTFHAAAASSDCTCQGASALNNMGFANASLYPAAKWEDDCIDCSDQSFFEKGSTYCVNGKAHLRQGFWRPNNTDIFDIYICKRNRCRGSVCSNASADVSSINCNATDVCFDGMTGVLCSQCVDGRDGPRCDIPCESEQAQSLIPLFVLLIILVPSAGLYGLFISATKPRGTIGVLAKLAIEHCQCLIALSLYRVLWGPCAQSLFNVASTSNMGLDILRGSCVANRLTYFDKFALGLTSPLAALILLWAIILAVHFLKATCTKQPAAFSKFHVEHKMTVTVHRHQTDSGEPTFAVLNYAVEGQPLKWEEEPPTSLPFADNNWKIISVDPRVGGAVRIVLQVEGEEDDSEDDDMLKEEATFFNPAAADYSHPLPSQLARACTVIIFLMHAPCTTTILKFFATERIAGRNHLSTALEVTTDTDEYKRNVVLAVFAMGCLVSVPIGYAIVMRIARSFKFQVMSTNEWVLSSQVDTFWSTRYGGGIYKVLGHTYANFRSDKKLARYWTSVHLVRKIGLISISVFFPQDLQADLQIYLGLLWLMMFMIATAYVKPYRKRVSFGNSLDLLSMLTVSVTGLIGKIDEAYDETADSHVCSFSSSWASFLLVAMHATVLMIFLIRMMLVLFQKLTDSEPDAAHNAKVWEKMVRKMLARSAWQGWIQKDVNLTRTASKQADQQRPSFNARSLSSLKLSKRASTVSDLDVDVEAFEARLEIANESAGQIEMSDLGQGCGLAPRDAAAPTEKDRPGARASSSGLPDDTGSNVSDDLQDAPAMLVSGSEPVAPMVPELPDASAPPAARRRAFSVEVTDDGDEYYVDEETQETTWALPDDGDLIKVMI